MKPDNPTRKLPHDGEGLDLNAQRLSDAKYLELLSNRLSPRDRRVRDVLQRAKSVYVRCGRDAVADERFARFISFVLANKRNRRDEGRYFFVTGESGSGKTSIAERLIAEHPSLAPVPTSYGQIKPAISYSLMGPSTLKYLGLAILREAGYEITRTMEQGEVWDMLPQQLHMRQVVLIHLDEAQHLIKLSKSDKERENVRNSLKGVTNYAAWPMCFVLSGMPGITQLVSHDGQGVRRQKQLELTDVSLPEERKLVRNIVQALSDAAELDASQILASDLLDRIAHASQYRYARIAQTVLAGIEQAAFRNSSILTREHFAYAYIEHSQAGGRDQMNPFLVDDWHRLEPGLFFAKED